MGKILYLLAIVSLMLTTGCKDVGESCEVTGDGFTRKDPCAVMSDNICLNWEITCPDGRALTPDECAGDVCGARGVCPEDQVCLQVDGFVENSRCVRATLCER